MRRAIPVRCSDGMCGAFDCPRCYPGNFHNGVYVDPDEEPEEEEDDEE